MSDATSSGSSSAGSAAAGAGEGWIARLTGLFRGRAGPSIRADLEDALAEAGISLADGSADGAFSPQERAMLGNVLKLRSVRVADVMVPRPDIVAVSVGSTLADLLRVFRTAGHSRLPVYDETLDDPRGMLHIRDFLNHVAAGAEATQGALTPGPEAGHLGLIDLSQPLSEAGLLRPVLFVPPSKPAIDLLLKMQATRTHMALVIDEYGGTDGLVSIEDLVEIVVGDIEDEHDETAGPAIVAEGEDGFIADARAPLEAVSEAIGFDLSGGEAAQEVETIGGLVASLAGRVPVRGEIVAGPEGLEFEVLDADPRRLNRVRIHRRGAVGAARRKRARGAQGEASTAAPPADAGQA